MLPHRHLMPGARQVAARHLAETGPVNLPDRVKKMLVVVLRQAMQKNSAHLS